MPMEYPVPDPLDVEQLSNAYVYASNFSTLQDAVDKAENKATNLVIDGGWTTTGTVNLPNGITVFIIGDITHDGGTTYPQFGNKTTPAENIEIVGVGGTYNGNKSERTDSTDNFVSFDDPVNCKVINVHSKNVGNDFVHFPGDAKYCTIKGNYSESVFDNMISVGGGTNHEQNRVINNSCRRTTGEMIIVYSPSSEIRGNFLETVQLDPNGYGGGGIIGVDGNNCSVRGNVSLDATGSCHIRPNGANETVVSGNVIVGGDVDGIIVTGGADKVNISNNLISGVPGKGVAVAETCNKTVIEGNTIINSGSNGVWVDQSRYVKIIANHIEGSTNTAVYFASGTANSSEFGEVADNTIIGGGAEGGIYLGSNSKAINNYIEDCSGDRAIRCRPYGKVLNNTIKMINTAVNTEAIVINKGEIIGNVVTMGAATGTQDGIHATNVNCKVQDNKVVDVPEFGILVDDWVAVPHRVVVTGNTLRDIANHGIKFDTADCYGGIASDNLGYNIGTAAAASYDLLFGDYLTGFLFGGMCDGNAGQTRYTIHTATNCGANIIDDCIGYDLSEAASYADDSGNATIGTTLNI